MLRIALTLLLLGGAASCGDHATAAARAPAHRFFKVAEGVYSAVGTGTMNVGSNSAVIINDHDVMIVDSHITPAAARALLTDLRTLTDKPVRYVVNTHFHFDHAHGNQVFPDDVLIIGHEVTRQILLADPLHGRTFQAMTTGLPGQVEDLKKKLAEQPDACEKTKLQDRLEVLEAYRAATAEVKPIPPNVTLRTKMTLHRGSREIQILFFGRGHTGGDVVVYLPAEKVLCSGDLITAGLSYLGDAYVDEWADTLEAVKGLAFQSVIPGHGEVFTGKQRIERFQAYLRDLWKQVGALKRQGLSAEQAAKRVDLTAHKTAFPRMEGTGIDVRGVVRMYEVMDAKGDGRR
jgi:glyoxylase-like metal-dependent hydrolase (beta-lactamase superfamily II)